MAVARVVLDTGPVDDAQGLPVNQAPAKLEFAQKGDERVARDRQDCVLAPRRDREVGYRAVTADDSSVQDNVLGPQSGQVTEKLREMASLKKPFAQNHVECLWGEIPQRREDPRRDELIGP